MEATLPAVEAPLEAPVRLHRLLMRLCADERADRAWLHKPWQEGKWACYSDVRVIARMRYSEAAHAGIPKQDGFRAERLFKDRFGPGDEFQRLPKARKPSACMACDGKRHFDGDECFQCGGTGYANEAVPMFDQLWSSGYLWLLAKLPAPRVRAPKNPDGATFLPMEVLFDGGQALLMPWRV